jgi:hypothetical protein
MAGIYLIGMDLQIMLAVTFSLWHCYLEYSKVSSKDIVTGCLKVFKQVIFFLVGGGGWIDFILCMLILG